MLRFNGKNIIDILYRDINDDITSRISLGKLNGDIVYNPQVKWSTLNLDQYINIGDSIEYFISINGKEYKITNIKTNNNVIIEDNQVFFNNIGDFIITLKYKTYSIDVNVNVSFASVTLN